MAELLGRALIVVTLLAACSGPESVNQPVAPTVRICDVVAAPERYEGRVVSFRARFSSDCYHGYDVITDMQCRYRGLGAYADSSMTPSKRAALYEALCPGSSNYDTDVTAVFTAT